MKAKDAGRDVRIFVSELVRSNDCDDFTSHFGYWYCVKGGTVGYFVTRRPHSGVALEGKLAFYEHNIFNVNDPIETKEQFAELITE